MKLILCDKGDPNKCQNPLRVSYWPVVSRESYHVLSQDNSPVFAIDPFKSSSESLTLSLDSCSGLDSCWNDPCRSPGQCKGSKQKILQKNPLAYSFVATKKNLNLVLIQHKPAQKPSTNTLLSQ